MNLDKGLVDSVHCPVSGLFSRSDENGSALYVADNYSPLDCFVIRKQAPACQQLSRAAVQERTANGSVRLFAALQCCDPLLQGRVGHEQLAQTASHRAGDAEGGHLIRQVGLGSAHAQFLQGCNHLLAA